MRILVTAGNTQTPIDEVRCITNIFTGRTGTQIALEARQRGHGITLLTSHPQVVKELAGSELVEDSTLRVRSYRTFEDLRLLMSEELALLRSERFDAIVHCAAISDYSVAGMYWREPSDSLLERVVDAAELIAGSPGVRGSRNPEELLQPVAASGKVKSSYPELWLKLTPTPKLVDKIRSPWNFAGILVKFKLEVHVPPSELLELAEQSRLQSQADLMVANRLIDKDAWAYLGPLDGQYQRIARPELASRLLTAIEDLHDRRT
jgi:phosphopantothenate-cysteine ligase/phosphopantothenoylcysteine decarboxylase/phosphopantothenate--cysteine ligase